MWSEQKISVIIPTYNRINLLHEALISLAYQTYPSDQFEVIVVDDGSTDGTGEIVTETYPFTLRYFWQPNQGDAEARNHGARQSFADFLVFLDDDILVDPGYLAHLVDTHDEYKNKIVVGKWNLWLSEISPLSDANQTSRILDCANTVTELSFIDVYSNNMSLWREAYFKIGMMQGLKFTWSSMWCDLDFAYRAYKQGFQFLQSNKAKCWHRDHFARYPEDNKKRMRTAAYRAVILFQKYPELPSHLPMFHDKTPIIWRKNPPQQIYRKLIRSIISSRPVLWIMERIATELRKRNPASSVLSSLDRYILGSHIYQGYREGLHDFGRVGASP